MQRIAVVVGVVLASLSVQTPAQARPGVPCRKPNMKGKIPRHHITMRNIKTGEQVKKLKVIYEDCEKREKLICGYTRAGNKGKLLTGCTNARQKIHRLLRDRKSGKMPDHKKVDRLIWFLYLVSNHFQQPIHIVSGRRPNARATSRHNKGIAADIRVPGVDPKKVWEYAKSKKNLIIAGVGLGYYPTTKFVHIDAREKSYFWIDDSGSGQKAKYRKNVPQPTWQHKLLKARKAAAAAQATRKKKQERQRAAIKRSKARAKVKSHKEKALRQRRERQNKSSSPKAKIKGPSSKHSKHRSIAQNG